MLCRVGRRCAISAVLGLALVFQMALNVGAAHAADSDDASIDRTPPRLSYADGDVS